MEHMPEIQEGFRSTFDTIGNIIDGLKPFIQGLINFITEFKENNSENLDEIREKFSGLFEAVGGLIEAFVSWTQEFWSKYGDEITAVTQAAFDTIVSIISTATTLITDIVEIFSAMLRGDWEGVWGGLKKLTFDILEGIKNILSNSLDWFISNIKLFGSMLSDNWENIFSGIKNFFSDVWDGMVQVAKDRINSIISLVNKMINLINGVSFEVPDVVADAIGVKSIGFDIPNIPKLNIGTNFVPQDMLSFIHQGEMVVPKAFNPYAGGKNLFGGGYNQTVNIYSPTPLNPSEIARKTKQASRQLALQWGV
jgi:phage-related protein